jgi:hypothetical protein
MKYLLGITIALLFLSCKDPDIEERPQEPLKTSHGEVIGTLLQAMIGPEGGLMKSPEISISIPEGAVEKETEFIIQEITPNPNLSIEKVYRILPENIILKKEVEITLPYTEEDYSGSDEDFLFPCYQDADGVWHKMMNCTLDKGKKELKVKANHFSDWGVFREIVIHSPKDEIGSREEVELELFAQDMYAETADADDYILTSNPILSDKIMEWKVISGGGTISGGKSSKVKYIAPETESKIEVIIEVTAKNLISKSHPDRPGSGGMVIVRKTLTILPEEYVIWTIGGKKFTSKFHALGVFNGESILTATAVESEIGFRANGTKLGKYSFGKLTDPKSSHFSASYDLVSYQSEYTECNTFKKVYGEGSVVFEIFGESGGGIVQGTFEGVLYNLKDCNVSNKHIYGTFRLKRTY